MFPAHFPAFFESSIYLFCSGLVLYRAYQRLLQVLILKQSPHLKELICLWNLESRALKSGIQLKESGIPPTIGIQSNFRPYMGQKADYFCFDWTFFCKVSGFLGRFNVRYHSNVTHWLLLHLLLPFFFLNNKFNLAPRSLVFFLAFST